jgi:serralysin
VRADDTDLFATHNLFYFTGTSATWDTYNIEEMYGAYISQAHYNFPGSFNDHLAMTGAFFFSRTFVPNANQKVVTDILIGSGTNHVDGTLPSLDVVDGFIAFYDDYDVGPGLGFETMHWTGANFNARQLFTAMGLYERGIRAPLENLLNAQQYVFLGSEEGDHFTGGFHGDQLHGRDGNDFLNGSLGSDTLVGGAGTNHLNGGADNDLYILGGGADIIVDGGGIDTIRLTSASYLDWENFEFTGDVANDYFNESDFERFEGSSGADRIWLSGANLKVTTIDGGAGNDTIAGGGGVNWLYGKSGNDQLIGYGGADHLAGGFGNDAYFGGSGHDTVYLSDHRGNLSVLTGWRVDMIAKTATTYHRSGIFGQISTETDTFNSIESVVGSNGFDVFISNGTSSFSGGDGVDTLILAPTRPLASGFFTVPANDFVDLEAGTATRVVPNIGGGPFEPLFITETTRFANIEIVDTNLGDDIVRGSATEDWVRGNDGNDRLLGLAGNDTLDGGANDDALVGGAGNDRLMGGSGRDSFVFNTGLGQAGRDAIVDFVSADDEIQLDNAVFRGIGGPGVLAANLFKANASGTATDADDRIVYNTSTGVLSYDSNGSAAGGVTEIALLVGAPVVRAVDFIVI